MRIRYTEYNGQPFRFQGDLDLGQFFEFVLAYGDEALRSLRELEHDPEQSDLLRQLLDEGLLEKVRGRFRLTPRSLTVAARFRTVADRFRTVAARFRSVAILSMVAARFFEVLG